MKRNADLSLQKRADLVEAEQKVKLAFSTVNLYSKRLGITRQKSLYPLERNEQARADWLRALAKLEVDKLVFIDETSAYLNLSREYGRAHSSERVVDCAPKGKKERF